MRRCFRCSVFVVIVSLAIAGCAGTPLATDFAAQMRNRVEAGYVAPYRDGDAEGWMLVFADDVVALHDGMPPLRGKEAVREFADAVAANFEIAQLDVRVEEVRRSGSWAWTWGTFKANFVARSDQAPPGVAGPRRGKFALLWALADDGRWRVIMDMGNELGPAR